MKHKENIFFSPVCLSMDTINRYLDETMPVIERHKVEKHMLECELCADAMDGYALVKDKKKAAAILSEINAGVKEMASERAFWQTRIAASVAAVFILGAGLFYLNTQLDKSATVAVNEKKDKKENTTDSVKESTNVSKPEEKTIAIQTPKKEETVLQNAAPVISSDAYIMEEKQEVVRKDNKSVSSKESEVSTDDIQEADKKSDKPESASLSKKEKSEVKEVPAVSVNENIQGKVAGVDITTTSGEKNKSVNIVVRGSRSISAPAESYKSTELLNGLSLYQEKKYKAATKEFEKSLKVNPQDALSLYYNGLSHMELKNYDKAIQNFNKIVKGMANYEDARWNKAMALLKKGDKVSAKTLLEEISKEEGPYKVKAGEELKKLE